MQTTLIRTDAIYRALIAAPDAAARTALYRALTVTGFNVIRSYIFGDRLAAYYGLAAVGMPDYGGYAVGYRVVQAWLARTGGTIEDATFLPADQILAESGYFDGQAINSSSPKPGR